MGCRGELLVDLWEGVVGESCRGKEKIEMKETGVIISVINLEKYL